MSISRALQALPKSVTISGMKRGNQAGSISMLLIPLIVVVLLLLGASYFAYWAYNGRQDYKNNVATKVSAAVSTAIQSEDAKDNAQFAQDEKQPLKTYSGPTTYGSIQLQYPRTWSGYVNEDASGQTDVDGYFSPNVVPDIEGQNSTFALRIQVLSESYSNVMQNYTTAISAKQVTAVPYSLPKVPSVIGTRLDGAIEQDKQGAMIILPLRNTTLIVWTEAMTYVGDFNNNILPNLSFSP